MKFNYILIVSFILFILTMGIVSAEDNTTNILTNDSGANNIIELNDNKTNINNNFYLPSGEIFSDEDNVAWIDFKSQDVNGTVAIKINGVEKINKTAEYGCHSFYISDFSDDLKFNTINNITLIYSGNEKYLPLNYTSDFYINYIRYDDFSNIYTDSYSWVVVDLAKDAKGNVSLIIDNETLDCVIIKDCQACFWVGGLKYGYHSYEFRYTGDNKYPKTDKSGEFFVKYIFNIDFNEGCIIPWSNTIEFEIFVVGSSNLLVDLNGIKREVELNEGNAKITIDNYKFGENKLVLTYLGDENHPQTLKSFNFNVIEYLENPSEIGYNSGNGFDIKLPKDAKGNVIIMENDSIISNVSLENGEVHIDLSNLKMGNHSLTVKYDGDDYKITNTNQTINILPHIIYDNSIKIDEDNYVSIELPKDADGNFTIEYDGTILDNKKIENGIASIRLDNLKIGEKQILKAMYTGNIYSNYSCNLNINVRNISRTPIVNINIGDQIVLDAYSYFSVEVGFNAEGYVNISVGNKTIRKELENGYVNFYAPFFFENLKMGEYMLEVSYSGDNYYIQAYNKTKIEITYISFNLPDKIYIGSDDTIYVSVSSDLTGDINLYINGKFYQKAFISYDEDDSEYNYMKFDLSQLEYGEYKNAEIRFMGDKKYPKVSKMWSFNATYLVDVVAGEFVYGQDIQINIDCYANINGNAKIMINDNTYDVKLVKGHGNIFIKDLDIGEYDLTFYYNGDSIYPSSIYNSWISVVGGITLDNPLYKSENNSVFLRLPNNAKGNLSVMIYANNNLVLNKTQKLINGLANISIAELKLGSYDIIASYNGDDYCVECIDTSIVIEPHIKFENLEAGKDNYISFSMPNDANGNLSFVLFDSNDVCLINETYSLTNGKVTVSLKEYSAGTYYAFFNYTDETYGSYHDSQIIYISKHLASIDVTIPNEIIQNDKTTIKFTLPNDAKGVVYVSVNDEYYEAKVKNGKANINIVFTTKGFKDITYGYDGDEKYESWSDYQYIDVLKTPTIKSNDLKMYYNDGSYFKVTVRDSFSKLVVGRYVNFYIGSKFIKSVKTDKKGVAKLKITQLPKTYKITVKYRGASITKKVTVKQVLILHKIKVKKSSQKLILKATLKKGKKALKYKKITFKFNGKTYNAKTNKYGVAKITIKKSVLKKLKVGKKIKYQATYVKDTIKKTAKVKK